jgi:hypothetical protein
MLLVARVGFESRFGRMQDSRSYKLGWIDNFDDCSCVSPVSVEHLRLSQRQLALARADYLEALQSANSLRRAASSTSCLPASVRLHQCMCWMRFELQRIPWKLQPGSRDCASSSWLRALAAYSLQLRIGTTPLSPRHESSVFWRSAYSRPRSRGDAPLHQLMCSTGSELHRGPAKLQPVAIWTWLIARATYSSQLSIGCRPKAA